MTNNPDSNSIFSVPPDVMILSTEECLEESRIILDIEFKPTKQVCPECASRHCRPDGFCKVRTIRHLPVAGKSVFLRYTPRHFVCDDCGAVFQESVSWIHSRLQMTEALFIEIYLSLTENVSIRSIAEKECVSKRVVQHVLELSAAERPAELPEVLCLFDFMAHVGTWNPDTHSWDMYTSLCGIADGSTGELLDIIPDTRVAGLSGYFGSYTFNQLGKVRYVVCDLGSSALSAAVTGRFFPSAMVGIESSHVIKWLNAAMKRIRMRILRGSEQQEPALSEEDRMLLKNNARLLIMRLVPGSPSASPETDNRLLRMLELFPDIREMYDIQKEFLNIIQGEPLPDAIRRDFEDWLHRVSASGVPEIRDAAVSLGHWRRYILNGLQLRSYSTGCMEIMHTIRKFRRISGGTHSFESMRNRLLLICGPVHPDNSSIVGGDNPA